MFKLKQIIPTMLESTHKGASGRIAVIGGSSEYTGAPYYSAISTLYGGADLSHIFCTKLAGNSIKSYSSEMIVHPYLITLEDCQQQDYPKEKMIMFEKLNQWMDAFAGITIGPGIGRDTLIADYLPGVIKMINKEQVIVLDADGLWYLTHGNTKGMEEVVLQNQKNIILTPNQSEFDRLWLTFMTGNKKFMSLGQKIEILQKLKKQSTYNQDVFELDINHDLVIDEVQLSRTLGNINILHKGFVDIITNGKYAYVVKNKGSSKRCGGVGDILAGLTCLYGMWGKRNLNQIFEPDEGILVGAALASYVVRDASRRSYEKHYYSLTAPKIINQIGETFNDFYNHKF